MRNPRASIGLLAIAAAASLVAAGFSWRTQVHPDNVAKYLADAPSRGFAVVELFTSQGCSSTPPANGILIAIDQVAAANNLPIHVLSYHVDYWNSLGWIDPYSANVFTARQSDYATWFGSERVYTPQMVVQGRQEFNGSHAARAAEAITRVLAFEPVAEVDLTIEKRPGRVSVAYTVRDVAESDDVVLALVQRHAETNVTCGENAGRRLVHVNVVRGFERRPALATVEVSEFSLPETEGSSFAMIAFVQNRLTGEIKGASRTAI